MLSLIYPWGLLLIIRYLRVNEFFKAGISLLFSGIFYPVFNQVSQKIIPHSVKSSILDANLLKWTSNNVNENIMVIILLTCVILGIIFIISGIKKVKDKV